MEIKNRKERKKIETEKRTGIICGNDIKGAETKNSLWKILLSAILTFMGTYGSVECFTTSFSIPYYKPVVIVAIIILCIGTAAFYINKKAKVIGYILLLLVFLKSVWDFKIAIRSGFSRIINVIMEFLEDNLNLPVMKRYAETIADGKYSVTVCLIFISCVVIIWLNIIISESMGFLLIMIITIVLSQLGTYFGLGTSYIGFFMLIICWVTIAVISISHRYRFINTKKPWMEKHRKNKHMYGPAVDSKAIAKLGFSIICFCFVTIGIVSLFYPRSEYKKMSGVNGIRAATIEPIRNFFIAGLSGIFNSHEGAGGVNGGRLGNVSSIKSDYKTDLKVTMIPLNDETVYLKAYVGSVYDDNHWEQQRLGNEGKRFNDFLKENSEILKYSGTTLEKITSELEVDRLNLEYETGSENINLKGRIQVENIDGDPLFVYTPYYTDVKNNPDVSLLSDDYIRGSKQKGEIYNFTYYPYQGINIDSIEPFNRNDQRYGAVKDTYEYNLLDKGYVYIYKIYADKYYTVVPVYLESYLENFCKEGEFDKSSDIMDNADYQDVVVRRVINYLWKNYDYSLMPGRTPQGKDFVNYFLAENKKGYCSHFASAATLIFRQLGIPARYIEGYVIDSDIIKQGKILENENPADWLEGTTDVTAQTVMELYVPDANAHAWVEIYKKGFGWIPIEVTPPNYEDDGLSGFSLTDILGEISKNMGVNDMFGENGTENIKIFISRIFYMIIILIVIMIIGLIARIFVIRYKTKKSFMTDDNNSNIINLYEYLRNIMDFVKCSMETGMSNEEYFKKLVGNGKLEDAKADIVYDAVKKAVYSKSGINETELEEVKKIIKDTVDGTKTEMGRLKRFWLLVSQGI